jgi:hypothetical protein
MLSHKIKTMKDEGKNSDKMWTHFQEHQEQSVKSNNAHKTAKQKDVQ